MVKTRPPTQRGPGSTNNENKRNRPDPEPSTENTPNISPSIRNPKLDHAELVRCAGLETKATRSRWYCKNVMDAIDGVV